MLSSPHAFLSLLPWCLHHTFCLAACPPLAPCVVCPPLPPPATPPPPGFFWHAWVLLPAGVGSGRPGGRSRVSAARGMVELRPVRDTRDRSVWGPATAGTGVACTVPSWRRELVGRQGLRGGGAWTCH